MANAVPMTSVVDEHLALYKDAAKPEENSPEEENIRKVVERYLRIGKTHQQRYSQHWPTYYKFFVGKQWPAERPAWRFSEVINIIWSTVWTTVAILTDNRPEIEFSGEEVSDLTFSEALTQVQRSNWQKYDWDQTLLNIVTESEIYDAAYGHVYYCYEENQGIGDNRFERFDPYYCYPDPTVDDINAPESRFFIYAKPTPTDHLKRLYPQYAAKFKPDVHIMKSRNRDAGVTQRVYTDVDKGGLGDTGGQGLDEFGGQEMTLWIKAWLRSDATEQIKEETDGNESYVLRKKYPKGRYVEIVNNIVVVDGPNGAIKRQPDGTVLIEPYDHGRFPVAKLVDQSMPGEFFGAGEIQQLMGPQKVVNYLYGLAIEHLRASGNPQPIVASGAGVDPRKITNEPGLVISASNINAIKREQGVPLPGNLMSMLEMAIGFVDKVSGVQDVTRGAQQPGVTSGLMLEGYVEASQTRIRLKARQLDIFLRQIGTLLLYNYLQFYSAPRVFRVTGKEGLPEFIEMAISTEDGGKQVQIRRFNTTGEQIGEVKGAIKGIPDVRVSSASGLPFARAQKSATANQLYANQAIDRQELLKAIDWPNYQEVLKRMEEKEAMAAQAAAQGAA